MKENEETDNKKKYLLLIAIGIICFIIGNVSGYLFNPKCGNFKEKTNYVLNGLKNLFKNNTETVITDIPIECNCPICSQDLEKEKDPCSIKVDVSGAVRNPGVYCFEEGSVIQDAVEKANGFDTAYGYKYISRKVNLAYELKDNQKIYFPFTDDLVCELQSFSPEVEKLVITTTQNKAEEDVKGETNTSEQVEDDNETGSGEDSCISINNGSKEELMELSGVGESTAKKIIDARPFNTIEDILNVSGIGDATFDKIKNDICL